MHKINFSCFKISLFRFCLLAISFNVNAQTKVVVIPMAGDDVIVEVEPTQKYIFITSVVSRGYLGGVAGADALCQSEADSIGSLVQGKRFKAWISDPTTNNINRIGTAGRFMSRYDLPYILVDGSVVASSFPDLLDGAIDNTINIDQRGTAYGPEFVWTGVADNGNYSSTQNCAGWTSNTSSTFGLGGATSLTGPGWSGNGGSASCNGAARLFCFEK